MRIKRMGVSCELLKLTFAPENIIPATKVVSDGIPADAVICGVQLHGMTIWLDMQSESFAEVKEGEEIPLLCPTFETLDFRGLLSDV